MDEQYKLTNQCLLLLNQSEMPNIEKLPIEIQLIKIKRLLLNDALPSDIKSGRCGQKAFEELLCQIRGVCSGTGEEDSFLQLNEQIGLLLNALGGHAIPEVTAWLKRKTRT